MIFPKTKLLGTFMLAGCQYIHTYIYTYIYICIFPRACMYMYICACICMYMHVYVHMWHVYVHMYRILLHMYIYQCRPAKIKVPIMVGKSKVFFFFLTFFSLFFTWNFFFQLTNKNFILLIIHILSWKILFHTDSKKQTKCFN